LQQGIRRYEAYVESDPDNLLLWLNLGDLYHRAAQLDKATACYERCVKIDSAHAPARSRLASIMISQHRFAEAQNALRALIDSGEVDAALWHNLGLALFHQDRWSEARDCFAQAAERGLHTAPNYRYLAYALHHLGRTDEAVAACRHWVELAGDADSNGYLALLEMDRGNFAQARELAAGVLTRHPQHPHANIVVGSASIERQEMREARAHFEAVLRQQPENGRAWLGLGLVQLYAQQHAAAIEALENAARFIPSSAGIVVALGWARLAARDVAGAERTFQQAIEVERNFAESHGGLAVAYAFQRKIDLAQAEIKVATRLDPAGFGAAFAKTILLKLQGQEQRARNLLTHLLEQAPAEGALPLIEHLRLYGTKALQAAKQAPSNQPPHAR
jgi:tetratricopeptide (TPR) repeat protein